MEWTKFYINARKNTVKRFKATVALKGQSMTAVLGELIEQYLRENEASY